MGTVHDMPPRGYYLARQVGRLAGVSGETIGQWARNGYIRSSQSKSGAIPRVYSFQDVAEAMIVHELLDHGADHEEVKAAIHTLRNENGSNWPLSREHVGVGDGAVTVKKGGRHYEVGKRKWQDFIDKGNLVRVAADLARGGWVVRTQPEIQHIEVDPDVMSGQPVIKNRRVPVEKVARISLLPDGRKTLRSDYNLTAAEIKDAQRWWQATQGVAA